LLHVGTENKNMYKLSTRRQQFCRLPTENKTAFNC